MMRVTNLTNSPYDLIGKDGPVRLPAMGSVDGEFTGEYIDLLRGANAVRVEDAPEELKAEKPKGKGSK